jgi:tRNA A-37 threonylcarbamoyl transferase component Bud32
MDITKLLFSAKTTDEKMLCIKFVRRYSKEVHQRCASGGFAPALYGFEHLPGGWYMVVMEYITDDYCCIRELSDPRLYHDELTAKLQSLHQQRYVHGDIRNTNVMVKKDCSPGFKLVDFDWSGIIGNIRYPMNVYRGDSLWKPDGAQDGQLILADHDIQMLDAMFS